MSGTDRPSRRAFLQVGTAAGVAASVAALAACSAEETPRGPYPSPTSPSASPSRDAGWVAAENARPGTTEWQLPESSYAGDLQLCGYAASPSVTPGEEVPLYLHSTLGDVEITAYRLGWYGGTGGRRVWSAPARVRVGAQPAPSIAADRTVTTSWQVSTKVPTQGWPEGSYLLVLSAGSKVRYLPLVIRSGSARDRLLIASAVTTYQAYNRWGGHSLYKGPDGAFATRSHRVSMDRPFDRGGAMELLKFEQPILQRAERLGLDLAYTTTWDLDPHPDVLAGARGLVSLGHDEYWTLPERDAVEAARRAGTNLGFLGANVAYWRIRQEDGVTGPGRMIAGYKDAGLDPVKGPTTTALWRQPPNPRPENSLTGMLYECYPATGALVVRDGDFPLFDGTGARRGSSYPGLVGTELDRAYPIAGTPESLQVVAHSPVAGPKGPTYGDATYYTDPSGAGVFATGTMLWSRALSGDLGGDAADGGLRGVRAYGHRQPAQGHGRGADGPGRRGAPQPRRARRLGLDRARHGRPGRGRRRRPGALTLVGALRAAAGATAGRARGAVHLGRPVGSEAYLPDTW